MLATAQPKPLKRSTVKRHRTGVKNANISDVYTQVSDRDNGQCRIREILRRFGFLLTGQYWIEVELAHWDARGLGGNPDLSRDTTANTLLVTKHLHTGSRGLHSGYLKVRPLTEKGCNGPLCVEFYEKLPSEL